VATHSRTSFTEMKSIAESVLRETGRPFELRPCRYSTFIDGRGAEVTVDGECIGYFGEMAPQIITNFDVNHPVIFLEIDVSALFDGVSVGLF